MFQDALFHVLPNIHDIFADRLSVIEKISAADALENPRALRLVCGTVCSVTSTLCNALEVFLSRSRNVAKLCVPLDLLGEMYQVVRAFIPLPVEELARFAFGVRAVVEVLDFGVCAVVPTL